MVQRIKSLGSSIRFIVKHRIFLICLTIIIIFLFMFFGTKLWLYLKLALGNDTVVRLEANKQNFYLVHGDFETLAFEASVKTNPFCKALCTYSFSDISNNLVIDKSDFTLSPQSPLKKMYNLTTPKVGSGLALYRFDIDCHSISTTFCQTKGEPSTRSILITANYDLNEEEKRLKESLAQRINQLASNLSHLSSLQKSFEDTLSVLNKTLILEDIGYETKKYLAETSDKFARMRDIWSMQDYVQLEQSQKNFQLTDAAFLEANKSISSLVFSYNSLIDNNSKEHRELTLLIEQQILNSSLASELNRLIEDYNDWWIIFSKKGTLQNKELLQAELSDKRIHLGQMIGEHIKKHAISLEISNNINYDILCNLTGQCISHSGVAGIANNSFFNLSKACAESEGQSNILNQVNASYNLQFSAQNYPSDDQFWQYIKLKLATMGKLYSDSYIAQIPPNSTNEKLLLEILGKPAVTEPPGYLGYDTTYALISELASSRTKCNISDTSYERIINHSTEKIVQVSYPDLPLEITFEEPSPKCCFFGKCENCCSTQQCRDNSSLFPLIFIHGHAFDKATSAEYSLEGFNKIQGRLEQDGYLNAGFITLNTKKDDPPGIWGLAKIPLTVRTSYYYDVFGEPENYILIQTKSENIDTYSLRLKELIDVVKYKTGKPKVSLVAFSMGGLVARRYIQIFGVESVDRLILIGTPNKGIEGSTADYCGVIGEKLECKDMNSQSLFINKLNRGALPNIPIHNIIGTGCKMGDEIGDGAIVQKNAFLQGANNYIINGTCASFSKPLHLALRDTDRYPEVYRIILNALKADGNPGTDGSQVLR